MSILDFYFPHDKRITGVCSSSVSVYSELTNVELVNLEGTMNNKFQLSCCALWLFDQKGLIIHSCNTVRMALSSLVKTLSHLLGNWWRSFGAEELVEDPVKHHVHQINGSSFVFSTLNWNRTYHYPLMSGFRRMGIWTPFSRSPSTRQVIAIAGTLMIVFPSGKDNSKFSSISTTRECNSITLSNRMSAPDLERET